MLKFRPINSGIQVITAILRYGKDLESLAVCGHGGYFAIFIEAGFSVIATQTKEDLWAMCAIGNCIYIAGTKSTYTYTAETGFSRWVDAPDMKEIVAYGSKLYGAGYDERSGGLSVNDGSGWKSIIPFEKIQAARSMVRVNDTLDIGAKSGKISEYNITSGKYSHEPGGVPGNSVLIMDGDIAFAAHQSVRYDCSMIKELTAPTTTKTDGTGKEYRVQSCYGAGVRFGNFYFLGGSDGLLAYFDTTKHTGKIVNQFTKGTIQAMEIIEVDGKSCLLLAGAGIKAQDGKLYNSVYIPISEVLSAEGEKPVEPPEPTVEESKIEKQKKRVIDVHTLFETELDNLMRMI